MLSRIGSGNRLFRHDRAIAVNSLRANFSRWHDRLTALGILAAGLAVAHSWSIDQAWATAAWAAALAAGAAGLGTGHLLAVRLAFHRSDGVLAADALQPARARPFRFAWHASALTGIAAITLIARPALVLVSIPAYVAGAALAEVTSRLTLPRARARLAFDRSIGLRLHRPIAGAAAAGVVLLSLAPAQLLNPNGRLALIGIEVVLFAMLLTRVDHAIARFRSTIGHRPLQLLLDHAAGLLVFVGIAAPGCWLVGEPLAAGILVAAAAAMLWLLAMRVFAYCANGKRVADVLVTVMTGLLVLIAFAMIILLPVVAGVMLWQLHHRAASKTWLLA